MKRKTEGLFARGLVLFLLMGLLMGCAKTEPVDDVPRSVESEKIQIGFSLDSKVLERWIRDVEVFVTTANRLGAEVDVQTANGDLNTQIEQLDTFIRMKKDVIVIVAVDCDKIAPSVQKAKDAGIKVVCYDRLINNAPSDLYISFDNRQVGIFMGEAMVANVPEGGKIMMICGPPSDGNAMTIEEGFLEVAETFGLDIVQIEYAEGWIPEYAFQTVQAAFANGITDIDGVMCGNDGLAVQAIKALAEQRLAGAVCVVGQDADVEACQKVVEGQQTMTVYKDIKQLAKQAAEYTVMLAEGVPLDGVDDAVKTGSFTVPQKLLPPIPVTMENMDEVIIDSGFHLRENVYLNVN